MKNRVALTACWLVLALCCGAFAGAAASGLVAEYKFDSIEGGKTADSSGKGNTAKVFGAQCVQNAIGQALLFDGVDDYVDCGNGPSLDLRQTVSIECWVRPDALPTVPQVGIAGKSGRSYGLTFLRSGRCCWHIAGTHLRAALELAAWQYVVATCDGTTACLYVKGELVASKEVTRPVAPGGHFFIGAMGPGQAVFPGAIGPVRVYACALAAETIAARSGEVQTEYPCYYTAAPVKLDGRLDEPAWGQAPKLGFLLPISGEPPLNRTEGRLLWDNQYLYVGMVAWDPDIWGYNTKRDSYACSEDCLELFFKTGASAVPYYDIEVNPTGAIYDAAVWSDNNAGGSDNHRWYQWNMTDLKVAIHIQGDFNNLEGTDEYWSLEMAIPFRDLPNLRGRTPQAGETWRFHLARYDWSLQLPTGVELSSTAYLTAVNFHLQRDWQVLRLAR